MLSQALTRAKQTGVRTVARWPVYRALPPSGLRTYAAIKYLHENSTPEALVSYLRNVGVPVRPLSAALVAARAVFRAGHDELLDEALTTLAERYPHAGAVPALRADLESFHGRYEPALAAAEQADRLAPGSPAGLARVVKLNYRVRPVEAADEAAAAAVPRFPRSPELMWQVALACASADQYARVAAAWQDRPDPAPDDLLPVVRQLATAASRGGEVTAAIGWYRAAIDLLTSGTVRTAPKPRTTTLAGLGARRAIEDLCRVLDGAGVRFFFAAGTALGLIRQGRPLAADGDIDLGVFAEDWDRAALLELFTRDPAFDLDLHPQTEKVGLRHRGGSPVDIFRFYPDGDKVFHDGVFVRWWNSPFEITRREIGGQSVPLPADPERYLVENYGPEWRTPWPGFDAFTDDAPNLEVTRPEFQRLHFTRRAYERLAVGDRAAADQELARAADPAAG
ncbi:hypothetical protein JQS43_02510 [Natronosporangium hydrolyticum]|uniref:LicD family protein n=1 Tax=Natronosporangium hydrolyticum TaxID=2811111 RepID=A0A895YKS1_9ACTN|nr:hypothetical protein [Natronosporangium hydrolyticum]QSB15256.1 hypothetical protein JQS43_02510 [Natronosporangium hydrolyticum]